GHDPGVQCVYPGVCHDHGRPRGSGQRRAGHRLRDLPERVPLFPDGLRLRPGGRALSDRHADYPGPVPAIPRKGLMDMRATMGSGGWQKVLLHSFLVVASVASLFPLVWMVLTSFKGAQEIIQAPPTFLPARWTTENYATMFQR